MAIPLSNEMREVQAPKTANLRAIDAAPAMQQMAREQGENLAAFGRLGEAAINAKQRYDKAEDAFKRNEAEREYNETTAELNEQLAEKQGEERVKFQPKYEAEMKLASDKYEAAINKVNDFEIREGSKRSINAWNVRNASNYQYDNYQNNQYLREENMGKAIISGNRRRVDSITPADTAESLLALYNDPDLGFQHEEEIIREHFSIDKGLPDDVVEEYLKDYRSKAMVAMANRLVQVTREYTGNAAYTPAINFLEAGVKSGIVSQNDVVEAKRQFQKERLALNVVHNPGWFIKDGQFNPAGRNKYAPDLTQYEYEYFLKQALGSYKPGQSGAGAVVTMALRTELDRYVKDWKADHGDFDDESIEAFIKAKAMIDKKVISKEEALKELQANVSEEKKSPLELINFGKTLSKMQAMWVLVDNQKGLAVGKSDNAPDQADEMVGTQGAPKMTLQQMQEEFSKDPNRYTLFQPLADYQPLAEERTINENKFRIILEALKKEAVFRDPGKAVGRKDEQGYYRTNNQERGLAILAYLTDTIPMASSQFGDIIANYTELLPQEVKSGLEQIGPNGKEQEEWLSALDPYGFVSDDDETSREDITRKLLLAMEGVLTTPQIQNAKQALLSRPFTQHIWTPTRDMENAAYAAQVPNSWINSFGPMMGANTATYATNQARIAALQKRLEGYQTEHNKLYNKTYQAQNATRRWAEKQVEISHLNGGYSPEQIRAAAAQLDVDKKQANRRRK